MLSYINRTYNWWRGLSYCSSWICARWLFTDCTMDSSPCLTNIWYNMFETVSKHPIQIQAFWRFPAHTHTHTRTTKKKQIGKQCFCFADVSLVECNLSKKASPCSIRYFSYFFSVNLFFFQWKRSSQTQLSQQKPRKARQKRNNIPDGNPCVSKCVVFLNRTCVMWEL